MPRKINMFLSNGNQPHVNLKQMSTSSSLASLTTLASNPSIASPKAPAALNAPILARVHNVRPGCGSCGRH